MQIFIPHPNIEQSVLELDKVRLNKQVSEATMCIRSIRGEYERAWVNHSVGRMYWPYLGFLIRYRYICQQVALSKGINYKTVYTDTDRNITYPHWWGNTQIHDSHRGMLYHKGIHDIGTRLHKAHKYNHPITSDMMQNHYEHFAPYQNYTEYIYPAYQAEITLENGMHYKPRFQDKDFWYLGLFRDLSEDCEYERGTLAQRYKVRYIQTIKAIV